MSHPYERLRIRRNQPAPQWDHALPIGNGRLGAMVFGAYPTERIQLNEETLWSGGPRDCTRSEAREALPEVRRLLFQGKPAEATELAGATMSGGRIKPYQTLGDLWIELSGHDGVADYHYELDLDRAVATTRYRVGETTFTREAFVSAPDQVLTIRIIADGPDAIDGTVRLGRSRDATTMIAAGRRLVMTGRLDGGAGLGFRAELLAECEGGGVDPGDDHLIVRSAKAVTLYLAAATAWRGEDPAVVTRQHTDSASLKGGDAILGDHVADHRRLFRRVTLDLGEPLDLPTDQRLERVNSGGADPDLAALYTQFARYLLIASSRPGCLPANLQGIWADGFDPPWNSDFHLNINLQMNYWPAETGNLGECHRPLFDLLAMLRESGRRTASVNYGCRGFVAHHIADIWGFTCPGDNVGWGLWPMGAAWLCLHLWEHWRFTGDREFLADHAYPIMKEAAMFLLDWLVEDEHGRLISGPSTSPENAYRLPSGEEARLCMGPSMDHQIIGGLLDHCVEASALLDLDAGLRQEWKSARAKLPAPRIGRHGQIMEWAEDWDEPEPGHRHISHLYALHPENQITVDGTPGLATAARKTLERRLAHGGGHTGWSRAWLINFYARLRDAERAHDDLLALLTKSTLPNLWDLHPPFQIDGNFGGAAGVFEMLLQSHAGEIALLPALPAAWPTGRFTGLRARGGVEVDLAWTDGRATACELRAAQTGELRLRPPAGQGVDTITIDGKAVAFKMRDGGAVEFHAEAGQSLRVRFGAD